MTDREKSIRAAVEAAHRLAGQPGWKADLTDRIASLADEDWEKEVICIPCSDGTNSSIMTRVKPFDVSIPLLSMGEAIALTGSVNTTGFCMAPPRSLMIIGFSADQSGGPMTLHLLLRDPPWDRCYDPGSAEFRAIVDQAGQSLYPEIDFDAIEVTSVSH